MRATRLLTSLSSLLALLASATSLVACTRSAPQKPPGTPKRFALLAGGSGEDFLIEDLLLFQKNLAARGWQVQAVAGSRDGLLPHSKLATGTNLLAGVSEILARAKSGDETLIVFHSHGMEQEFAWGQKSHSIASEDSDPSGAQPGFDLDAIEPELIHARARGVRIALVDLSCYSGRSLALQGPACTLTLAAPSYVSLCSSREVERHFTASFISTLEKSSATVDLETHFLQSRKKDRDSVNLPQLSSRTTPGAPFWSRVLAELDPLDLSGDIAGARTAPKTPSYTSLEASLKSEFQSLALPLPLRTQLTQLTQRMIARRKRIESTLPLLAQGLDSRSLTLRLQGRSPLPISPGSLSDLLGRLNSQEGRFDDLSHPARRLLLALEPVRTTVERAFQHELKRFSELDQQVKTEALALEDEAGQLLNLEREIYELRSKRLDTGCAEFQL